MKTQLSFILVVIMAGVISCRKPEIVPESNYYNELSFADESTNHPKNATYQTIIDKYVGQGIPGMSVMINDQYGTWLGAGGYADIASEVGMEKGNRFLIASISKVFTATAIFSYVDEGKLSIEDPINK